MTVTLAGLAASRLTNVLPSITLRLTPNEGATAPRGVLFCAKRALARSRGVNTLVSLRLLTLVAAALNIPGTNGDALPGASARFQTRSRLPSLAMLNVAV